RSSAVRPPLRSSPCRRPRRPLREFAEMPLNRTTDSHATPTRKHAWALARSLVLACCAIACAAIASGCLVTPKQPASAAPPQLPEGAAGPDAAAQIQSAASRTEFKSEPTDRQSFQVHIDFGRVFESQGDFDAAVMEYQNALTVVETKKRGTL